MGWEALDGVTILRKSTGIVYDQQNTYTHNIPHDTRIQNKYTLIIADILFILINLCIHTYISTHIYIYLSYYPPVTRKG